MKKLNSEREKLRNEGFREGFLEGLGLAVEQLQVTLGAFRAANKSSRPKDALTDATSRRMATGGVASQPPR